MQNRILYILIFLLSTFSCICQIRPVPEKKDSLTFQALYNWPFLSDYETSETGEYIWYSISKIGNAESLRIVKSLNRNDSIIFYNVSRPLFISHGNCLAFVRGQDSLFVLTLSNFSLKFIDRVSKFSSLGTWLFYSTIGSLNQFVFYHNKTGKCVFLNDYYQINQSPKSDTVFLIRKDPNRQIINIISTNNERLVFDSSIRVSANAKLGNLIFGKSSKAIGYVSKGANYCFGFVGYERSNKMSPQHKEVLITLPDSLINYTITLTKFNSDNSLVYFLAKPIRISVLGGEKKGVDVWSWNDSFIQSQQVVDDRNYQLTGCINIKRRELRLLTCEDESVPYYGENSVITLRSKGDYLREGFWNQKSFSEFYIVNAVTSKRTKIPINFSSAIYVSRSDRYLVGMGPELVDLYCYDTWTGKLTNLTSRIKLPFNSLEEICFKDRPYKKAFRGFSFSCWSKDSDDFIIVYDNFDIWLIDVTSYTKPINLTHFYGRKNNIIFRLIRPLEFSKAKAESFVLSAFDLNTFQNGFYRLGLGYLDPKKISMGKYSYQSTTNQGSIQRALKSRNYTITRSSMEHSENIYITKNFRDFKQVSFIQPENLYNWGTSKIISYSANGLNWKAAVYLPQNLDMTLKHPVIIYIYEKVALFANQFHRPGTLEFGSGDLDISWFVNKGYIVVAPDIYYTFGKSGKSALIAVSGVYSYLKKLNFVDTTKIGLQGHSFGGFETNYIITQSKFIKAAVSSCGISDHISFFNDLRAGGASNQSAIEQGQSRMGTTMWLNKDIYIENSPIFFANSIVTPILLVANRKDLNVSFSQGVEWFNALRRLNKVAFMLQYGDEGHGFSHYKTYFDFLQKETQFFDYYLKNRERPNWLNIE